MRPVGASRVGRVQVELEVGNVGTVEEDVQVAFLPFHETQRGWIRVAGGTLRRGQDVRRRVIARPEGARLDAHDNDSGDADYEGCRTRGDLAVHRVLVEGSALKRISSSYYRLGAPKSRSHAMGPHREMAFWDVCHEGRRVNDSGRISSTASETGRMLEAVYRPWNRTTAILERL